MALLSRSGAGAGRHLSSHFIAFAWGMSIALVCKNLTILQTTVADRSRGVQSGRPYADESISGNNTGISLVISYCNGKMSNYRKVFASTSVPTSDITIISKCGFSGVDAGNVTVEILPNKGREGHSYLHWIVENYDKLSSFYGKEHVVFFFKDHIEIENYDSLPLAQLASSAKADGFACLLLKAAKEQPVEMYKFHITEQLATFQLKMYKCGADNVADKCGTFPSEHGKTLGEFAEMMNIKSKTPLLTPVCMRGNFAVSAKSIVSYSKDFYIKLLEALFRGDNIEEGHYLERLWGAIFTRQLFRSTEEASSFIKAHSSGTYPAYSNGQVGHLKMKAQNEDVGFNTMINYS